MSSRNLFPDALAPNPVWHVLINHASGSQDGHTRVEQIRALLGQRHIPHKLYIVRRPQQLLPQVRAAAHDARQVQGLLVGVGGDGTLNATASQAIAQGLVFSALPQGTFNYFGREHGFPDDIGQAIDAIVGGAVKPTPVGRINDHLFLVNASFGLYPQLLEEREAFKAQWGRSRPAAWLAGLATLMRDHRMHTLKFMIDGQAHAARTSTVFVGINRLQLEQLGVAQARQLPASQLVALTLKPVDKLDMLGLIARGAVGRLADAEAIQVRQCHALTLQPTHYLPRRKVRIAFDGERAHVTMPIEISLHPEPLRLLAPTGGEGTR